MLQSHTLYALIYQYHYNSFYECARASRREYEAQCPTTMQRLPPVLVIARVSTQPLGARKVLSHESSGATVTVGTISGYSTLLHKR
jgi:hypothetical protein